MPDEVTPNAAPTGGTETPPPPVVPKPTQAPVIQQGATQGAPLVTEPKRVRLSADEAIPDDADLIELPRRALESRLARHTKTELTKRFGTADFDEINGKLARLGELEKAEEDRKRSAMTEQERVNADLKRERELRVDAERRVLQLQEDQVVSKQEGRIVDIGVKHLRTKYVKFALTDLASHLRNEYTDGELKTLKDTVIDDWFKGYAENNPELARKPAEVAKPATRKVPLTTGARPNKPANAAPSGAAGARSFAPSSDQPMTSQEARSEAAKSGYRW